MPFDPSQSYGTVFDTNPQLFVQGGTLYRSDTLASVASEAPFVVTGRGSAPASVVQKLAAAAIKMVVAPTGTMANNGAITLGTALPSTYANCYLLLPANAIAAGSAAGWYFAQMSSTTVGVVFNNTYASGIPVIPTTVAFVTTGPGAYTGATGAQTGIQITVPGNTMGPNGRLRISTLFSNNNSAGTKAHNIIFGAQTIKSIVPTTNLGLWTVTEVANQGVTGSQVIVTNSAIGPSATASGPVNFSTDTTVDQLLKINFSNNTATDFAVLENFLIEVIPG